VGPGADVETALNRRIFREQHRPRAAPSASAVQWGSQAAVPRSLCALVPLIGCLTGISTSQSTMRLPTVDAAIDAGADRAAGDQWRRCGDASATGQCGP
jgi:hypothetical protein